MGRRRYYVLMEKIIQKLLFNREILKSYLSVIIGFFVFCSLSASMLDKTIALVGDEVLTYRKIQKIYVISRIADGSRVSLYKDILPEKEFERAKNYAIKTEVVKAYLTRIALKSPSEEAESKNVFEKIKMSFKNNDFKKFLDFYELDRDAILGIIKDKLVMERFFSRAALLSENVTDREVMDYYEKEKEGKFFGRTYQDIKEHIRKYLTNLKRQERVNLWLKEQTKQIKLRVYN